MRHSTSAANAPSREQTDKRLREFLKGRKFNFLAGPACAPVREVELVRRNQGEK